MSNKNTKYYAIITACSIIIIGFWLYSLKLNLSQPVDSTDSENDETDLTDLKNTLFDAFRTHPLQAPEPTTEEQLNQLTNKMAEEIKNQNSTPTADWLAVVQKIKNRSINSTTEWLTYKNDESGFEFKYPKEWFWNNIDKTLTNYSQEEGDLNGGILTSPFIKININVNPLDSKVEKSILDCGKSDEEVTIKECKDVYINNVKFKKTISHIEVMAKGYAVSIVATNNDNIYYLTGYFGGDYNQISQVESIFNTFKFLK